MIYYTYISNKIVNYALFPIFSGLSSVNDVPEPGPDVGIRARLSIPGSIPGHAPAKLISAPGALLPLVLG